MDRTNENKLKFTKEETEQIRMLQQQLEFYFSDVNLAFDQFMIKIMKKHKRQFVEAKVFLKFNAIKEIFGQEQKKIKIQKKLSDQQEQNRKEFNQQIPFKKKIQLIKQAVEQSNFLRINKLYMIKRIEDFDLSPEGIKINQTIYFSKTFIFYHIPKSRNIKDVVYQIQKKAPNNKVIYSKIININNFESKDIRCAQVVFEKQVKRDQILIKIHDDLCTAQNNLVYDYESFLNELSKYQSQKDKLLFEKEQKNSIYYKLSIKDNDLKYYSKKQLKQFFEDHDIKPNYIDISKQYENEIYIKKILKKRETKREIREREKNKQKKEKGEKIENNMIQQLTQLKNERLIYDFYKMKYDDLDEYKEYIEQQRQKSKYGCKQNNSNQYQFNFIMQNIQFPYIQDIQYEQKENSKYQVYIYQIKGKSSLFERVQLFLFLPVFIGQKFTSFEKRSSVNYIKVNIEFIEQQYFTKTHFDWIKQFHKCFYKTFFAQELDIELKELENFKFIFIPVFVKQYNKIVSCLQVAQFYNNQRKIIGDEFKTNFEPIEDMIENEEYLQVKNICKSNYELIQSKNGSGNLYFYNNKCPKFLIKNTTIKQYNEKIREINRNTQFYIDLEKSKQYKIMQKNEEKTLPQFIINEVNKLSDNQNINDEIKKLILPLAEVSAFNYLSWINEEFIVAFEIPNINSQKQIEDFVNDLFGKQQVDFDKIRLLPIKECYNTNIIIGEDIVYVDKIKQIINNLKDSLIIQSFKITYNLKQIKNYHLEQAFFLSVLSNDFNYQLYESYGDTILGFLVAYNLFLKYEDYNEGKLTEEKKLVVQNDYLTKIYDYMQLDYFILINLDQENPFLMSSETYNKKRSELIQLSHKQKADVIESLIFAFYQSTLSLHYTAKFFDKFKIFDFSYILINKSLQVKVNFEKYIVEKDFIFTNQDITLRDLVLYNSKIDSLQIIIDNKQKKLNELIASNEQEFQEFLQMSLKYQRYELLGDSVLQVISLLLLYEYCKIKKIIHTPSIVTFFKKFFLSAQPLSYVCYLSGLTPHIQQTRQISVIDWEDQFKNKKIQQIFIEQNLQKVYSDFFEAYIGFYFIKKGFEETVILLYNLINPFIIYYCCFKNMICSYVIQLIFYNQWKINYDKLIFKKNKQAQIKTKIQHNQTQRIYLKKIQEDLFISIYQHLNKNKKIQKINTNYIINKKEVGCFFQIIFQILVIQSSDYFLLIVFYILQKN